MLNVKKINEVLSKAPLCQSAIIRQRGMAKEYCAMGALAKYLGATDLELENVEASGGELYRRYHEDLKEVFGIETLNQFQNLMRTNDSSPTIERNERVKKTAALMSAEQVEALFREAEAEREVSEIEGQQY